MRLTNYTDYALRTLIHLAAHPDQLVTVNTISHEHGIAKNHLTKVVHKLGVQGFIETVRGRCGGIRLSGDPRQIRVGDVVRCTETNLEMGTDFEIDGVFGTDTSQKMLTTALRRASTAFFEVLDNVTLDKLLPGKSSVATVILHRMCSIHPSLSRAAKTNEKA